MTTLWTDAGKPIDALAGGVTVDMILSASGLAWEVEKRQAMYRDNAGEMKAIRGQYAPVRTDNGRAFPATVGPVWEPFQNADLVRFALSLGAHGEVVPVKAGPFGTEGERTMIELRIGRELQVRRGEERGRIQPFLTLYNAHDGSGSIVAHEVMRTLVCSNGAVSTSATGGFKVRHTRSAQDRMQEGATLFRSFQAQARGFEEQALRLADTSMSQPQVASFIGMLLTGKDDPDAATKVIQDSTGQTRSNFEEKGSTLLHLFSHGIASQGRDRLDALDAVTEFIDHQRNRARNWRAKATRLQVDKALDSMTFGSGAKLKARAFDLLTR